MYKIGWRLYWKVIINDSVSLIVFFLGLGKVLIFLDTL